MIQKLETYPRVGFSFLGYNKIIAVIISIKKISNRILEKIKWAPAPKVLVIGCVHGDEIIGKKIISYLEKVRIYNGTLITLIGNKRALQKKKRFIDQDLNRAFPGKTNGNYEQKAAFNIKKLIKEVDFVFDIHSTTTDVQSLAIITKKNRKLNNLINLIKPKRVALMKESIGKNSLTYYSHAGITLEYGKNSSKHAKENILNDVIFFLGKQKMTDEKRERTGHDTEFYRITKFINIDGSFIPNNRIRNFKLVKKGKIIATIKNEGYLRAKESFYPILFGEKAYKNGLGFAAKKVKRQEIFK